MNTPKFSETIVAQASARGKSGIAVFRISGEKTQDLLKNLTQKDIPEPGILKVRRIYNFHSSPITLIDKAMVVFFAGPNSFTGEDVAEIHTHGSIAVANLLLETLCRCTNVRMAEPGEFSKRAFFNGKMDLTEVDGLADLIDAETAMQHKQALRQMEGELGKLYSSWKKQIIDAMALLEADIDFPEEDLQGGLLEKSKILVRSIKNSIESHINDNRKGEILRSGISLGIFGEPNVGKSSLINCLAERDVSIVTDVPGTTRDILEAHLDIGGYPFILSDTAGIHEATEDKVEKIGIEKAKVLFQQCDIKILVFDATKDAKISSKFATFVDENTILVANKIDLTNYSSLQGMIGISCKTQDGIKNLTQQIVDKAAQFAGFSSSLHLTRPRYRASLKKALENLEAALSSRDTLLVTEEMRLACSHMQSITGEICTDEILSSIFANFCIGK